MNHPTRLYLRWGVFIEYLELKLKNFSTMIHELGLVYAIEKMASQNFLREFEGK